MHVVSTCSLPVASLIWQPQPSLWTLTVVCRATFLLRPGESVLAPDQEDPIEQDDHWNDDPGRSLRLASDLVPMKPRADITLVGNAFAPGHAAVRSLVVRLLVGELDKSIEVQGDRSFDQDGVLHEGPLFSRMPLLYERAAGGADTTNPVGLRGQPNAYGRITLPNLQQPGMLITSPSDYIEPVGFGPIAPGWPTRHEKLGRAAPEGARIDVHAGPLPDDLDPSYFNHAPRDQQVQLIRDNERIVLEHLHPDHPRFVTNLPGVRPRATVERQGITQSVPLRCDTLWLDTDRALCTLTWRAQVPIKHPDEQGRVAITLDSPGQTAARAPSAPGRLQAPAPDEASETLVPAARTLKPTDARVLPFAPAPPPPPPLRTAPEPRGSLWYAPEAAATPMTVGQLAAIPAGLPEPAKEAAPAPSEAARPTSKLELGRALHLVWYDPEILPRVRRKPAFQPILNALDGRPVDPDLDDPSTARDPSLVEDRRDVFEVLARGGAADEAALNEAVERAVRDDGKFVPPFLLIAGEVRFPFDELSTLKATLSIVTPFATGDELLKMTIADAREFLRTPDLLSPPGVIEGFTARVQDAFRKMRKAVPQGYLDDQTERVLVEKRLYQRREVFGAPHLRAQLFFTPSARPWPLYVPESIAGKLPMFARFPARILAEASLQEDQYEAHPNALRASAIGRVAPMNAYARSSSSSFSS